ncbi:MAG: UPF0149 family protein [Dokdonella sp.]
MAKWRERVDNTPIEYEPLSHLLSQSRLGITASELHGSLAGYLSAGGVTTVEAWPAALMLDTGDGDWPQHALFAQLYHDCQARLVDPGLRFEPLLPADSTPLSQRAETLVEWCRGFLGGFGLAGVANREALSEDASEVLHDFASIAASRLDCGDNDEDEFAFNEVREFVRVGAMLLGAELMSSPRDLTVKPARNRLH